jgi:hypothetical protein
VVESWNLHHIRIDIRIDRCADGGCPCA